MPCGQHQVCQAGTCVSETAVVSIPYGSAVTGTGVDVAVDSQDNVYVVGFVAGPADFGSGTIWSIGQRDTFLVSYTPAGALRWVHRFGDQLTGAIVGGTGVAIDGNDNVVIVGSMEGDVDFGAGPLSTVASGGSADTNLFVAGFTSTGAYRFAKNYAVDAGLGWADIAADQDGDVFVAAAFDGTATLGSATFVSAGSTDVLVAGFSSMGVPAWAHRMGGGGTDSLRSMNSTHDGTIYVVGSTSSSPVDLGNGPTSIVGSGGDAYVTSFTSSGAYRWSKLLAGSLESGEGVAVDASGNVFMSGTHQGGTDVVPGSMSSNSFENVFLESLDATGAFRWSWTLPSTAMPMTSTSEAFAAVSTAGDLVTAGDFDVSLDAGFGPMTTFGHDIFLASYHSDGTPRFAQKFGASNSNAAHAVAVDSLGRCYVTGEYTGSPNYGDGAHSFSSTGGYYLLRYVP